MLKTEAELLALAAGIKAVILDVDGVLTFDAEFLAPGGGIIKGRSHRDGQGVSLLRAMGLPVVFITSEAETSPGCEFIRHLVDKWNSLPSSRTPDKPTGWPLVELFMGTDSAQDKGGILQAWLERQALTGSDCAVMGDDLVDVPMLQLAGLKIAPAEAEAVIIDLVDWVTPRSGGRGAVRDLANLILRARGINPLYLPTK